MCIDRALKAKNTRLTTQRASADTVRNSANGAYQNKLDELNNVDEQVLERRYTIGGGGLEDRDFFQWIERLVMDAVGKAIEMDAVPPD